VLALADARILAVLADAVVLVVDPGRATRPLVAQSCQALARTHTRVLGLVVNRSQWLGDLHINGKSPYDERVYAPREQVASAK